MMNSCNISIIFINKIQNIQLFIHKFIIYIYLTIILLKIIQGYKKGQKLRNTVCIFMQYLDVMFF